MPKLYCVTRQRIEVDCKRFFGNADLASRSLSVDEQDISTFRERARTRAHTQRRAPQPRTNINE